MIFFVLTFVLLGAAEAQVANLHGVQEGYSELSKLNVEEARRLQSLQHTLAQDTQKRTEIRDAIKVLISKMESSGLFDFRYGVSATIGFTAPMAPQYSIEAVQLERGKLALYCAPGVNFTTDVGAGVSMNLLKTLRCYKHEDYTGNFFGVALNFAPIPGLSFLTNVGYGWGSNMEGFLNNLNEKIEAYQFDPGKVPPELSILWAWLSSEVKNKVQATVLKGFVCRLFKIAPQLKGVNVNGFEDCGSRIPPDRTPISIEDAKSNLQKAGDILGKEEMRPENLVALVTSSRHLRLYAPNLVALFESFDGTFSGCDAISLGGGIVGKSFVPFSISANITHYTYGMAFDFNMYRSLKHLMQASSSEDGKVDIRKIPKAVFNDFIRSAEATYEGVKTLMTCEASTKAMIEDTKRLVRSFSRDNYKQVFPQNIPAPKY